MSTNRRATARSFAHAKCDVSRTLASRFPFAAAVEVTTTTTATKGEEGADDAGSRIMRELREAMARTRYYECAMSIADVLDPHFVHAHVKRGHEEGEDGRKTKEETNGEAKETTAFAATTTMTRTRTAVSIDSDDVWCVTTQGRFVGSFMRDTAEVLGLQTTRDGWGKRHASVNLRRRKFQVSNRFHDRIGVCARMLEDVRGKSSVRCAFSVNGEYVDVKFPRGVDAAAATTRENVVTSREWIAIANDADEALLRSIEPPARGDIINAVDIDDLERVLQWIGRMSLGFTPDVDARGDEARLVRSSRWQGFILHPELERVIDHARALVNSNSTPWAVVTVWAYRDVPSNLTGAPRAKTPREPCRPRGCDAYVIVVFPNDRYVTFNP